MKGRPPTWTILNLFHLNTFILYSLCFDEIEMVSMAMINHNKSRLRNTITANFEGVLVLRD